MEATVARAREGGEPGRRALYFCGSIRGGRDDRALYQRIVSRLRRFGVVLTEHVAFGELGAHGEAPAPPPRLRCAQRTGPRLRPRVCLRSTAV